MPKTSARSTVAKSSKKKVQKPVKKAAVKRASSSRPTATKSASVWTTPYLAKEQDHFHATHPNAKNLIAVFIVLTVIFLVLYLLPLVQ